MAWEFITAEQLRDRLSGTKLRRLTDDNRDGVADPAVLTQVRKDASSKVASYLRDITDLAAVETAAQNDSAHEVARLTLDVAEYMLFKRHPEAARGHDWVELMRACNAELKLLRDAYTKLDVEDDGVGTDGIQDDVGAAIDTDDLRGW